MILKKELQVLGTLSPLNEVITIVVPNIGYGATRMRIISHVNLITQDFLMVL